MSRRTWNVLEALPESTAWLLEASAGTGKTYQLASLFVRLVGEYGVPLERILAMTFTKAATSELRARVRLRLEEAARVCGGRGASDDPVLAHVRTSVANDDELARRFTLAVQSFDAAPIRTIHGFSQSVLEELSFETGHDRSLALTANVDDLVAEIVSDALADLWSRASSVQVGLLRELGVTRKTLVEVARATTGAQAPRVEASAASEADARDGDPWRTILQQTEALSESFSRVRVRHFAPGGDSEAVRSFLASVHEVGRWNKTSMTAAIATRTVEHVRRACATGALPYKGKVYDDLARFREGPLEKNYKGRDLANEPFWPFFQDVRALLAASDALHGIAEPLAPFALLARPRLEAALLRRRAITFDGVIAALAERIDHEVASGGSSALAATLRGRYEAVLVDEFQDTDAAQWTVLREAFLGHRRLFLIGDPKQAIYAFRGANVHVYLEAARAIAPENARTMTTNWRSDGLAVEAMNALWREGSNAFDTEGVDYVRVEAEPKRRALGIAPALEISWMDARLKGGLPGVAIGNKTEAVAFAAEFATATALDLLSEDSKLPTAEGDRRVVPSDIAVLVPAHRDAAVVRRSLIAHGIPAVYTPKESVFATAPARWLQRWLEALAAHGHPRAVTLLALTPLIDWSGEEIAFARESENTGITGLTGVTGTAGAAHAARMEALVDHVRGNAERWSREGFGRLFDRDCATFEVFPRLLAMPFGEREATNLRHLFELVHAHERRHRTSAASLAAWLSRERTRDGNDAEELQQRLESDARAVTIETVHGSKGLEYGFVLLPCSWQERQSDDDVPGGPVKIAGPDGERVNVEGAASARRRQASEERRREEAREAHRKLYVALTRARHRTVAWLGPLGDGGEDLATSALGRVVLRDPARAGVLREGELVGGRANDAKKRQAAGEALMGRVEPRLEALADSSHGAFAWRLAERRPSRRRFAPEEREPIRGRAAPWPSDRPPLLSPWQTTSFTALTRAASPIEDALVSSAVPGEVTLDELGDASPAEPTPPRAARRPELALALTRGGGTAYGTFVHAVFEHTDFRTGLTHEQAPLAEFAREAARRATVEEGAAEELVAAMPTLLKANLARPEVTLPEGFSLASIVPEHRLDELAFDLALGAGTRWERKGTANGELVSLERVIAAMAKHPAVIPSRWVTTFAERVRAGRLSGGLTGILRGSIDLVFRVPGPRGDRAFVVDYKTNRLPGDSLASYTRAAMASAMSEGDYLLQALLYTVALHRMLRLRVPGYRYEDHVGGFLYLFVRGLGVVESVAESFEGEPCPGVYADRFPEELVVAVDEALEGGRPS